MSDAVAARPRRWTGPWLGLLGVCVLAVGTVDTVLLAFSTGFFTNGFNGVYIDGLPAYAGFAVGSLLLDVALVLGLWSICLPLLSLLRARPLQTWILAGAVGGGLPLLVAAARYNLYSTLGNMVNVSLLRDVATGSSSAMASQALESVALAELLVPWLLAASLVPVAIAARRLEARLGGAASLFAPPGPRSVWAVFVCFAVLAAGVLVAPSRAAARVGYGLSRKPAAYLLRELVGRVTDVDFDGYGLASRPRDPAPFDGGIHPFAVDVPANGIDENGVAGDHPAGFAPQAPAGSADFAGDARPDVLLVFLETFRADLLDRRLDGAEITPFLNRLAREGARSDRAWVHSPMTVPSRAQLFAGRLVAAPGEPTLIDDFREREYAVGYFSGQDDSYGNGTGVLGVERADVFYDARQDVERRSSRSSSQVSLQVSWKLLSQRVGEYLDARDPEQPLFLYVNFTDAHFPYFHDELDPILDVEPIRREDIRADRAERIRRGYANAVANVDRAIELLARRFRSHVGNRDHAIVVTADHGQAFYEKGFLGHGQDLDDAQARVPLILWGVGGDWPEPIGLADVRGLLKQNLGVGRETAPPVARFVPDPQRRVLQWVGSARRPRMIGLRGLDRLVLYEFPDDHLAEVDGAERTRPLSPEAERPLFERLVRSWESVQARVLATDSR